jgi:hypothetical protein
VKIFNDSGDLHKARDYFNAAAAVFRELKNKEKHAEMIVKVAEKWEKEALNSPSNIVATSSYEKLNYFLFLLAVFQHHFQA